MGEFPRRQPTGVYVPPAKLTVARVIDNYLATAGFEAEAATRSNYAHALRVPRERLGTRLAQSIARQDIEELRDWMLTGARVRGGKRGTGLGPRSVRLALGRLSAAFEQAVHDKQLAWNPCLGVRLPKLPPGRRPHGQRRRRGSSLPWRPGTGSRRVADGAVWDAPRGGLWAPLA